MGQVPNPRIEPLGGNRYKLIADYIYEWTKDSVQYKLIVPVDFETDLASIPRLLWSFISPFDLGAAVVPHDWLYYHRGNLPPNSHFKLINGRWADVGLRWTRKAADRLMGRIMREARVCRWRRRSAFCAVWFLGWLAWMKHRERR
jgi:hypothetical protein